MLNAHFLQAGYLVCLPACLLLAPARAGEQSDARSDSSAKADAGKSRSFSFTYRATVTSLPPAKTARIWLPVPPSNEDQEVQIASKELPVEGQLAAEPRYGNKILYLEAQAGADGKIPLSVTYRVTRHELRGGAPHEGSAGEQVEKYLQPDSKVPVGGKPLSLIKDKQLPADQTEAARVLYDVVNGHMRYSMQGTGWGHGDAVWACESGYGNCTDFHSLFISLARAQRIPCKFEIGFGLPPARGSGEIPRYHCWAKFYHEGQGWIPVDISEANKHAAMKEYYFGNLTENRVMFSAGRDIELVPRQEGKPLNYFVYPYVEVDGKPYPAEKVERKFSYEDMRSGQGR